MKRTIVLVPGNSSDILRIVAEADNLADAKRVMRDLPDGTYDIASFQELGVEVGPPVRTVSRVVRHGTPTVTRARKGGHKPKAPALAS